MRQHEFEQRYQRFWDQLGDTITALEKGRRPAGEINVADFPAACRRLCHQLALTRQRGYSLALTDQLNQLVLRAHRQLYRQPLPLGRRLRNLLLAEFPAAVREQWRWHLTSALALLLPGLMLLWLVLVQPEMALSVLNEQTLTSMESMYQPGAERQRDAEDDLLMFGFYVYNNVGIAFRTFAGGLLLGIGALFIMIFNGGFFGVVTAHLMNAGASEPFFTFVIAHGAPELTAIVLAGGAGLQLGAAIFAPGRLSRGDALRERARQTLPVIAGVFAMLVLAAFVEAFWSPRQFAPEIKYGVGALCWLLTFAFLLLGGRRAD